VVLDANRFDPAAHWRWVECMKRVSKKPSAIVLVFPNPRVDIAAALDVSHSVLQAIAAPIAASHVSGKNLRSQRAVDTALRDNCTFDAVSVPSELHLEEPHLWWLLLAQAPHADWLNQLGPSGRVLCGLQDQVTQLDAASVRKVLTCRDDHPLTHDGRGR
jgi:hypothetical protein